MQGFATSREHLLAELERIDILLQTLLARARRLQRSDDRFQGLCITEEEVDGLLARPIGIPAWATREGPADPGPHRRLNELANALKRRARQAVRWGVRLRLDELARHCDLDALDRDILLVCLAPEIDLRYERLFSYLQDDVTKKRPSVELVLNILISSLDQKLDALARFRPGRPLIDRDLITPFDDPHHHAPPLLGKFLKIDDRVVSFLLDSDEIDERLRPFADLIQTTAPLDEFPLSPDVRQRLASIGRSQQIHRNGLLLYLQGPGGSGRRLAAEALSQAHGGKLLVVDLAPILEGDPEDVEGHVRRVAREGLFQEASILLEGFDRLLSDDREVLRAAVLDHLQRWPLRVLLAGSTPWVPATSGRLVSLRLKLSSADYQERLAVWKASLDGRSSMLPDMALTELASKFRLSPEQIRTAAAAGQNLALSRAADEQPLTVEDLEEASRLQSTRGLSTLARKIEPRYTWDDIVLPADRLELLREICSHVRRRSLVYGEWGFDRKLSLGKGLNVLFGGPSGTGKTMAAEILAGELGLELYRIDLSTVVSKYIGETEKNLARIFAEAETSNAILFFDEADALFGKRSEVKDSHDRYANIEIGYLLQRMEEYEGVVILATNFRKNMDEAFVRRLHFTVEFPFPTQPDRRRIWTAVWPTETPRDSDIDFDYLARRFEISGGNIRSIAVAASFLAAEDGQRVKMGHLMRATRREYQKMGKIIAEGEFEHR